MKYDLNRLNSFDFEHLAQAVCKKNIASGFTSFGEGPDGGREATYNGEASFPSQTEIWSGYWVLQAKFRIITSEPQSKDFKWLQTEISKELKKYKTRSQKVSLPENLIFFTNIILTAAAKSGGQDKIAAFCKTLQETYKIKNIHVISNHDIQNFLDLDRNLAVAFAPFILPGDVLGKMLKLLDNDYARDKQIQETICRFLEIEFSEDVTTKLDQAGKLVANKINLEKVFIDLQVLPENNRHENFDFITQTISLGNNILKWKTTESNRFVLKAGPGQGKSTLTQFLAQTYRAFLLHTIDDQTNPNESINAFINDYNSLIAIAPSWPRLPFKIILKDYAGWIAEIARQGSNESTSIQSYLAKLIAKKTGLEIRSFELEILIKNMPTLVIFDGLDEVPVSSNREEVLTQLNLFADMILRRMDADVIVVATTRPQGYSKEFDSTKYTHLNIQDLSEERCKIYLERLLNNTIDNILERETKSLILARAMADPQVSRIMKTPLQASIMAILVNSGGEPPTNKFDLFERYYNTILNREKQRGISKILNSDEQAVTEIHYKLGIYLQAISEKSTNPSATIPVCEFEEILTKYLEEKEFEEAKIMKYNQDIQNASIDRLVFISHLEDQRIGFAIRSLQEYFAANGYIDNIADYLVKERVKKIAINSYWNNTLIFITGYIAKHKKYLVDYILSICGELNGEDHNPNEETVAAVTKLGSWLALDIVNEGIFRNNPKIENRFCNYLTPLLSIPTIDKHIDFVYLPKSIIEKWIISFLIKELEINNSNRTCWHIISALNLTSKLQIEDFIKYVPTEPEIELKIILQIVDKGIYDDSIMALFNRNFKNYPQAKLFDLFSDEDNYDFLEMFFYNISKENIQRAWELLIFSTIRRDYDSVEYMHLFQAIGFKLEDDDISAKSLFDHNTITQPVTVIPGFTYEILGYMPSRKSIVTRISKFSSKVGGEIIKLFCNFIELHDYESYLKLIKKFDSEEIEYSKRLKFSFAKFDSLNYFMSKQKETNEQIFNHAKKEIFEIIWRNVDFDKEKTITLKKYSWETSYSIITPDRILDFAEHYQGSSNPEVSSLFRMFMGWHSVKLSTEFLDNLKNDENFMTFYRKTCKTKIIDEMYFSAYRILDVLYLLTIEEIIDYIKTPKALADYHIEFVSFFDKRWLESKMLQTCLNKCIKVIQWQIISNVVPSYNYLFQTLIYFLKTNIDYRQATLPFVDIEEDENIDPYGILLSLLNPELNTKKIEKIRQYLEANLNLFNDADLRRGFIYIMKTLPLSIIKGEILIMLNSMFTSHGVLTEQLFEMTKHYAQSLPSLVEINGHNVT